MSIRIGHLGPTAALGALLVALCAAAQLSAQKRGGGHTESYGNNLSFPVIWAEGVQKSLRTPLSGAPELAGPWWYWWGTDELTGDPLSCPPDEDDEAFCDDGIVNSTDERPGEGWYKVYLQQDSANTWQAGTYPPYGELWKPDPVFVDWIDWGDNLEAVNWYLNSQVRTEVVLIEDLDGGAGEPLAGSMTQYGMRHLSGLGIDEMHGLSTTAAGVVETVDPNTQATVYSHCARFLIQRLTEDRDSPNLSVIWDTEEGVWTGTVNDPIYNEPVWAGGDGPGYYSAEINVKGKIIYGYTWNVNRLNDGKGDYRLTFKLDEGCPAGLNTYFDGTQILLPTETEVTAEAEPEEEPDEGGVAVVESALNLTYIDIRILDKKGGGKKVWR